MRLVLLLFAFLASGCAQQASEVLPISRAIVGNAQVVEVRTIIHPSGQRAVAALDQRVRERGGQEELAALVTRSIQERARAWGLSSGRPVRVIAEIDRVAVTSVGGALFGREDRLGGTAFIRDAATDEPLGQLYIDVRRGNGGLIATVIRGGGVRERLAAQFADRIAAALSGRRSPGR